MGVGRGQTSSTRPQYSSELAFSLELFPPLGGFPPRAFAKISRSVPREHSFGVPQSRRPGYPMSSHDISWFRVGCPGIPHGPVQFGIPLSGSSWEDVKLIRGTTCVLAGRPPSPGSGRRLSGHRPVGIRQGGCLLHERAFSLDYFLPWGFFLP